MYVNHIVFTVLLMVFRQWILLILKLNYCTCWKYIQFRLEKRLNLAFLLWMADLFQDCEIKSYLYFGPDHNFLCPDLLYVCVCVCTEELLYDNHV